MASSLDVYKSTRKKVIKLFDTITSKKELQAARRQFEKCCEDKEKDFNKNMDRKKLHKLKVGDKLYISSDHHDNEDLKENIGWFMNKIYFFVGTKNIRHQDYGDEFAGFTDEEKPFKWMEHSDISPSVKKSIKSDIEQFNLQGEWDFTGDHKDPYSIALARDDAYFYFKRPKFEDLKQDEIYTIVYENDDWDEEEAHTIQYARLSFTQDGMCLLFVCDKDGNLIEDEEMPPLHPHNIPNTPIVEIKKMKESSTKIQRTD